MKRIDNRSAKPRGFVLLAVLLALASVTVLAAVFSLAVRQFVDATSNRIAIRTAAWHAFDCSGRARAAVQRALSAAPDQRRLSLVWRHLDDSVSNDAAVRNATYCNLSLRSAGDRLDVNAATPSQLERLLYAIGLTPASVDSLRDALMDWRDPDDVPRRSGAETVWYVRHHRRPPRNGPFANEREVLLVRGVDQLEPGSRTMLLGALTVDRSRIDLARAPPEVLETLPGFSPQGVEGLLILRGQDLDSVDLVRIATKAQGVARDSLAAHFSELAGLTTPAPDAWILRARGAAPHFPGHAVLELRILLAGSHASIVRRRAWVE